MVAVNVNQIMVTPLKRIQVAGGDVLHGMKCSDPGYDDFGEAYFSMVEVGAIKAWKRHLRMTLNFVVPLGTVLFAFIDGKGLTRTELAGDEHYVRLTVPPGIWFGFKGLGNKDSMVLNIASVPHDPGEVERRPRADFDYVWK